MSIGPTLLSGEIHPGEEDFQAIRMATIPYMTEITRTIETKLVQDLDSITIHVELMPKTFWEELQARFPLGRMGGWLRPMSTPTHRKHYGNRTETLVMEGTKNRGYERGFI